MGRAKIIVPKALGVMMLGAMSIRLAQPSRPRQFSQMFQVHLKSWVTVTNIVVPRTVTPTLLQKAAPMILLVRVPTPANACMRNLGFQQIFLQTLGIPTCRNMAELVLLGIQSQAVHGIQATATPPQVWTIATVITAGVPRHGATYQRHVQRGSRPPSSKMSQALRKTWATAT